MQTLFTPGAASTLPVRGLSTRFPVRRVYCIGRNYAEHAQEMGFEPDPRDLFFFTKWGDAVRESGGEIPYPPGTANFQHEVELVVAIGGHAQNVQRVDALQTVFGYAVGFDMTRRDLQLAARDKGRPWDAGKNFDASAPIGRLCRAAEVPDILTRRLSLEVNGELRQQTSLQRLLFPVDAIIAYLSSLYELMPGDLIMTGTPAGVAAVQRGDRLVGRIDGIDPLEILIV